MSISIPISDKIEFLVTRKIPNAQNVEAAYRRPQPINAIGSRDKSKNDRIFAEIELRYEVIQDYRKELKAKSPEEIDSLFIAENIKAIEETRLKAEQEEQALYFNAPQASADFDHWSKTKHWTIDEAVALSFAKAPELVNWRALNNSSNPKVVNSNLCRQYKRIYDLAIRAATWNELFDPVLPGIFIAWARRLDIPFPKELEEKVIARGGNIADWKTLYESSEATSKLKYDSLEKLSQAKYESLEILFSQFKEQSNGIHNKAMEILDKKNAQIGALLQEKESLESTLIELEKQQKNPVEKPLKTREKDTLLKILISMAIKGYLYKPRTAKNSAVSDIAHDTEKLGIDVSDDTVRKWLSEASEFLPSEALESL